MTGVFLSTSMVVFPSILEFTKTGHLSVVFFDSCFYMAGYLPASTQDFMVALYKASSDQEDAQGKSGMKPCSLLTKPANLDPASIRLNRDLREMEKDPPPLCSAGPVAGDIFHWNATIIGTPCTLYDGGIFELRLTFPHEYPYMPPEVVFYSRMFHPNISVDGRIGLGIFGGEWNPVFSVSQILLYISSMLNNPDPDVYLNHRAAIMYREDPTLYSSIVRYWVKRSTQRNLTTSQHLRRRLVRNLENGRFLFFGLTRSMFLQMR